jgi:hypothetical protein
MCDRKFGIWLAALACCVLAMSISCDLPTDEVEITSSNIGGAGTAITSYGAGMVINVSLEEDIAASAPSVTTIYKDGNPTSVTIEAVRGSTCQWFVDGKLRGTNAAITLDSANVTTGDHFVTLMANKNGIPYSREYIITVVRRFR